MNNLSIRGAIIAGDACGGCSSGDQATQQLGLGGAGCCDGGLTYDAVIPGDGLVVATAGLIGQNFVDLPIFDSFTAIEFLKVKSSSKVRFRFNPTRPTLTGSAPLPVGGVTAGSAVITATKSDGTTIPVTVNFSGASNMPALVVAAINAAFGAAGAPQPPDGPIARLSGSTLVLVNPGIGPSASLALDAGAPADLGLGVVAVSVVGTSQDTPDIEGLALMQFPRSPGAPTKVQVSGTATLDLIVAGRVTA